MTPGEALERLRSGNDRFLAGLRHEPFERRAGGEPPVAAILGCIDSRVPPEVIFDQGIGDVFCSRVAGNFVNADLVGGLEFAASAGAALIVVLGHTDCMAIRCACGAEDPEGPSLDPSLGNFRRMLGTLAPAVAAASCVGPRTASNDAFVDAVIEENVQRSVAAILELSPAVCATVEAGTLEVVGAIYDVATGRVTFLPGG
ncbi:MAG: carbonic anhydrase [Planctomycetota bacterium]|jgi:carbonic anhydrase